MSSCSLPGSITSPTKVLGDFCKLLKENTNISVQVYMKLLEHLPRPWTCVLDEDGLHILLLARKEIKAVQREIFFSFSGEVKITVHCKPVSKDISDPILQSWEEVNLNHSSDQVSVFVQQIGTIVRRFQSYEVCMGVDEVQYKPLWNIEECGEVDKNPFQELRYQETFRPFACQLLVSTKSHLRRRCSICIQTKIRLTVKLKSHKRDCALPTTANVHLDRNQLLVKVKSQQKKLKYTRQQLIKLRAEFQKATSRKGINIDDSLSEELLNICMTYVNVVT